MINLFVKQLLHTGTLLFWVLLKPWILFSQNVPISKELNCLLKSSLDAFLISFNCPSSFEQFFIALRAIALQSVTGTARCHHQTVNCNGRMRVKCSVNFRLSICLSLCLICKMDFGSKWKPLCNPPQQLVCATKGGFKCGNLGVGFDGGMHVLLFDSLHF